MSADRRFLGFLIGLLAVFGLALPISCSPDKKPVPDAPPHVFLVSPAALVRTYREERIGDNTYTGTWVNVALDAEGYVVSGDSLHWFSTPDTPPSMIFIVSQYHHKTVPKDNKRPLTVEGVCQGIVRDGKQRKFGVDYYVVITEARFTQR